MSFTGNTVKRCACGQEDCRPGQRNGPICHRKANRESRARLTAERKRKAKELHDLKLALIAKNILKESRP